MVKERYTPVAEAFVVLVTPVVRLGKQCTGSRVVELLETTILCRSVHGNGRGTRHDGFLKRK